MCHRPTHRRTPFTAQALALALGAVGLSQVGCAASDWVAGKEKPAAMTPNDFIDESDTALVVSTESNDTDAATPPSMADVPPGPVTIEGEADQTYVVNAMIGHINGEAVYAGQILAPLEAQLAAMGRRDSGDAFLEQAAPLILGRLQEAVMNKLVLGEAERDLTDRDRQRLDFLVQQERDEKLRYYGQGSLAAAQANFEAQTGTTLDFHLRDYRERLTIRRYMDLQVRPKIVVNPRDVERYYDDNKQEYVRPASRVIRFIIAPDQYTAQTIEKKLEAGESFEQLAKNADLNRYNPVGAGLFNGGKPVSSEFVVPEVQAAIVQLGLGEHAGPIQANDRNWFIEIVEYTPERNIPLEDVKNQIERQLELEQFKFHADRFRDDLIARGSYTSLELMMEKLVEVAEARYDSGG